MDFSYILYVVVEKVVILTHADMTHSAAAQACAMNATSLPVLKDRNSIMQFKEWLLSFTRHTKGDSLMCLQ